VGGGAIGGGDGDIDGAARLEDGEGADEAVGGDGGELGSSRRFDAPIKVLDGSG
jgi:hypothetical protein